MPQNVRLIEVPCAGTVAARHLLDAFESGADGVMLCTCHTDNCQSETGNRIARKRAAAAREMLITAGVDDRRLRVTSVAANMGTEMVDMVTEFAADTAALDHR